MEIGGHSKTHAHLISLSDEKLTDEIVGDKITIEQEIGKPIAVFAYPFLEHDARTDAVVKNAGYTVVRDDPKQFKGTVMTNSFDVFLKAL
jgi:peptidoglycan/xylan/chitin deacetylase (PgdA/CDA1 family)